MGSSVQPYFSHASLFDRYISLFDDNTEQPSAQYIVHYKSGIMQADEQHALHSR